MNRRADYDFLGSIHWFTLTYHSQKKFINFESAVEFYHGVDLGYENKTTTLYPL